MSWQDRYSLTRIYLTKHSLTKQFINWWMPVREVTTITKCQGRISIVQLLQQKCAAMALLFGWGYEARRICWCFCFLWLVIVGFGFWYLIPFIFFSISFNSLTSSLSVMAAKESLKEGKKETKMPFKFKFYFWIQQPFRGWENSTWNQWKWLCHPDKVFEYTNHFQWLISPKWVFFIMFVSAMLAHYKCKKSWRP